MVLLAGVPLFVGSEQTDQYFAWTIRPPLTAAVLGALYWSAVPFVFLSAREREWANARLAVPGVLVFTTLGLIATVLHADRFHFTSTVFVALARYGDELRSPSIGAFAFVLFVASVLVVSLIGLAGFRRHG